MNIKTPKIMKGKKSMSGLKTLISDSKKDIYNHSPLKLGSDRPDNTNLEFLEDVEGLNQLREDIVIQAFSEKFDECLNDLEDD